MMVIAQRTAWTLSWENSFLKKVGCERQIISKNLHFELFAERLMSHRTKIEEIGNEKLCFFEVSFTWF